ncbi:hypothetical protein [uncultured Jatrophihabitans sp.]|uniref:hypothetical protein n=1 Tax=uncultured Jatrophihabitans sp. TaxID=1610747 RepID=UPI0035CA0C09
MTETRRSTAARDDVSVPGAKRRLARSRGVGSGLVVLLLGIWGALIPFVGPYFSFYYTPKKAWHWEAARGWLEVFPGAVAFVGGLLLLVSASRAAAVFGAWLGVLAGAWFVVGLPLATVLHIGSPGNPGGTHRSVTALETLFFFFALGALILFFAATALGRLTVVSLRDVHAAERRHDAALAERDAVERERVHHDDHVSRREAKRTDADRDGAAAERGGERRDVGRDDVRRDEVGRDGEAVPPRHGDTVGEHAAGTGPGAPGGAHEAQPGTDVPTNQPPPYDQPPQR